MISSQDHDLMARGLEAFWPKLEGARIFMTGGTGFIGRWMLEALARAPIAVNVTLLSRDPSNFAKRAPHLAHRFNMVAGNILDFEAPAGEFTHIIHGATDASADLTANDPRRMFDTILDGTRRTLDLAHERNARFIFMSSGAVYGVQPPEITHVSEDHMGGPDPLDPKSAYAEGKRAAETLCAIYGKQFGVEFVGARIFALLGPLLSLDIHFAAGNFIRDALAGQVIRVNGSGAPIRSYLYAADLAVWMWALTINGTAGRTYNVGSDEAISIADLARRTAAVLGSPGAEILGAADPGWNPGRYVPSNSRIQKELGVATTVDLDEAIRRTAASHGWKA